MSTRSLTRFCAGTGAVSGGSARFVLEINVLEIDVLEIDVLEIDVLEIDVTRYRFLYKGRRKYVRYE